jgi:hypothetical protein
MFALAQQLFTTPTAQAPEIPVAVLFPLVAVLIAVPWLRWRNRRNRSRTEID